MTLNIDAQKLPSANEAQVREFLLSRGHMQIPEDVVASYQNTSVYIFPQIAKTHHEERFSKGIIPRLFNPDIIIFDAYSWLNEQHITDHEAESGERIIMHGICTTYRVHNDMMTPISSKDLGSEDCRKYVVRRNMFYYPIKK